MVLADAEGQELIITPRVMVLNTPLKERRKYMLTAIFPAVLVLLQKYWMTTGIFPKSVPYRLAKNRMFGHVNGDPQYR